MPFIRSVLAGTTVAAIAATTVIAGGHNQTPQDIAVKTRKAHMQLYAYNLGILGGMARGNMEYDAAKAQSAADDLLALTKLDQSGYWIEGTDSMSYDDTRLLPTLFDNMADAMTKGQAMSDAAMAMQAAAGSGLEGLQGAIGAVGGACGSCHKAYREPDS